MRSPFANIPPVVKNLLIINVLFFVATYALRAQFDMVANLSAFYFDSPFFKPWQVITYMFMHAGFEHIFFNMFALFMFGPMVEYTLGSKKFFNYYFITGIGALALHMLVQAIQIYSILGTFTATGMGMMPNISQADLNTLQGLYSTPILGVSGAVFGILVAFGMLFPDVEMMILFIPVPIKAKYVVLGYVAIELFSGFGRFQGDSVAHFAHLGGALFGYLMLKIWGVRRPNKFY
ncbi:rhomboid family intramembrane serine protease [Mucilaginibacter segetis]|uniref:Rhomboid family intramembrane serine protease n=1 Tax=Mucilaginibacter segetis TaxID=2793071 RepID=A0A934PNU1_9SPHI|nr:rhomboid family intramembrane serine protease [Mucilaginibacter segetis]MBK0377988.1 rhomboid family intramembrane serine protease [Mucilaginibacter segetis]